MMAEPMRADFEARRAARSTSGVDDGEALAPTLACPSCHAPLDLDALVERLVDLRARVGGSPRDVGVTPREQAVLDALLQGYRTHQIAMLLGISTHTVRKHLRSLYGKADCASQAELVSWARSRRVLP